MTTLDKIKSEASDAAKKLSRGESLTKSELEVLTIYNRMTGGTARNAGKRKVIRTGK